MKRVLAALFGTTAGLVALLSFKTHPATTAAPPAPVTTTAPPAAGGTGDTAAPAGGGTPSSSSSSSAAAPKATGGTYTGDSVDTQWGPVQVRITVSGGRVTRADAVVFPLNNPRDQEINSYAIPALNQEAVAAGNAKIDMISGATYTSGGYIQSLQSALDRAGL